MDTRRRLAASSHASRAFEPGPGDFKPIAPENVTSVTEKKAFEYRDKDFKFV
tara:strand:- start:447 stop:602 length:156 start_codon:yes stop_codon:yes gene_type:complete